MTTKQLVSELGRMWRELNDKEKMPFFELAQKDRARYIQEVANAKDEVNTTAKETNKDDEEAVDEHDSEEEVGEEE